VIFTAGRLYSVNVSASQVKVFDAEGGALSVIELSGRGTDRPAAVAHCEETGRLFIGTDHGSDSRLLAIDAQSGALLWSADIDGDCLGVAVVQTLGSTAPPVVVASARDSCHLYVYSISDGTTLHDMSIAPYRPLTVSSAPHSDTAYIVMMDGACCGYSWDGSTLVQRRAPESVRGWHSWRVHTVMPAAFPGAHEHLVVGSLNHPELTVLSLPELNVVCTYSCGSIGVECVVGLAADPTGRALAICSYSGYARSEILVLAWPLEGMGPLEVDASVS
jgi:hypothetical protein